MPMRVQPLPRERLLFHLDLANRKPIEQRFDFRKSL
jgi:hypothetical protein